MLGHSLFKIGAAAALLMSSITIAAPVDYEERNATEVDLHLLKRATGPNTATSTDIQTAIVNAHNTARTYHHAPALKWNPDLATYAQKWINKCQFKHSVS